MASDKRGAVERGSGPAVASADLAGASQVMGIIKSLPPEAVLKIFEIAADVVRTQGTIATEREKFLDEMARLQEGHTSIERRLSFLRSMVVSDSLSEEAKLKLVDAICQVAVK